VGAFSVNSESGKLTYLASTPTERQPRGFAIAPDGKFLVAAGERSDTISIYAIGEASGALTLLRRYPAGEGANWVEIISID
jgi:6-phosphogluconolactonase